MSDARDDFLATLGEPEYSSPDHDPAQPIVLYGVLNGARTLFYASPTDVHDYGRDLHQRAAAGEFGPIADYVPPPPPPPGARHA